MQRDALGYRPSTLLALLASAALAVGTLSACGDSSEDGDGDGDDDGNGEEVTVAEGIFGPFGGPMSFAKKEQKQKFKEWKKTASTRFGPEDGLGPSFNAGSCQGCHEQPAFGGSSSLFRNFFVVSKGSSPIDEKHLAKGGVQLRYRTEAPYRNPSPESADSVTQRNAIPFFGIGALAQIPKENILENADPDDSDGDGISGRPNRLGGGQIGRFGRKAQGASIEAFVRGALYTHSGITTEPLSSKQRKKLPLTGGSEGNTQSNALSPEGRSFHQIPAGSEKLTDGDDASDPELSSKKLFEIVAWVRLLAAPKPAENLNQTQKKGKKTFKSIGCADCHIPALEGPRGKVPAYTDLLLHDMGSLGDGVSQGKAKPSEFRTQPLWGLAATDPYLHDGRASTIQEAIQLHDGEAEQSRKNFEELSASDKKALVQFLRSLGGGDFKSSGTVAPDSSAPKQGEYGAPLKDLSNQELSKFNLGRLLLDGDVTYGAGLGPKFNADSCRGCHAVPTPGGGGPIGTNVTREGHLAMDGTFTAPPDGTLLHRFTSAAAKRPTAHKNSNVFELRQPPPLYGLGLIDEIPNSTLRELADPNDSDGDGISGRLSVPKPGRVGKFGWKAPFPTLEDFIRDALSNEMGLTLPERTGFYAGKTSDEDDVSDPEFPGRRYDALIFYVANLAPPPDAKNPKGNVSLGEQVFKDVGCASCHVPTLETKDGREVELYSDLLLHQVAPEGYQGIQGPDAGPREFHTPPLWGIRKTGPYMHDGLSSTLDGAIRRHAGEAKAAKEAYVGLSKEKRKALIAFLNSI